MIYHKLLLCITVIAYFLAQADAEPADPLSPSLLGESMSMPLPGEPIQDALNVRVITGASSLSEPDSHQSSFSVLPQMKVDADSSIDSVNVTGAWSFNLRGKDPEQIKLHLVQNNSMVKGQGVINRKNETENATASGSITGDKMNLDVRSMGTRTFTISICRCPPWPKDAIPPTWQMAATSQVRSRSLFPQISSTSRMHPRSMKRCQTHKRRKTQQSPNLPRLSGIKGAGESIGSTILWPCLSASCPPLSEASCQLSTRLA